MYSDVVDVLSEKSDEERLSEFESIGYEPYALKEIVNYAQSIARDSYPFEPDKIFIHCGFLRNLLNRL